MSNESGCNILDIGETSSGESILWCQTCGASGYGEVLGEVPVDLEFPSTVSHIPPNCKWLDKFPQKQGV